jgi:DNA-binding transcriptional LysR family regulator
VRTEKELLIVRVLDEQQNFGRAASILNMTQPALSRALQRIEQDLGVLLFDRSKTHVAPSADVRHSSIADITRRSTRPRRPSWASA